LLRCISPFLALLGPREMSELRPHSGPKRTFISVVDRAARAAIMTRFRGYASLNGGAAEAEKDRARR